MTGKEKQIHTFAFKSGHRKSLKAKFNDCTGDNMVCFAGQRYISLKGNTSSASASEGGRIRTLTHVLRESLTIIE